MKQSRKPLLSQKHPLQLIAAFMGAAMCLTASQAYGASIGAPIDANAHQAVAAVANVNPQPLTRHAHELPSVFRNGNVYIKVAINGHPAAWMNLDTGTTDSLIDADYAATIGLKLVPKSEGTEGFGSVKTPTFTTGTVRLAVGIEPEKEMFFESLRLGGMTGPDGVQLAGLLGHNFLEKHVVVIDYKSQEVYFDNAPQRTNPRDIAMTLIEGVPVVKLKVANQSVNALIDTGGTYAVIITPATAKALGIDNLMNDAKPAATVGHGGDQHIVIGKSPPFSIGDIAVHGMSAAYTTLGTATDTLGAGMSLGIVFLKQYKLTLNYLGNTVRLEP